MNFKQWRSAWLAALHALPGAHPGSDLAAHLEAAMFDRWAALDDSTLMPDVIDPVASAHSVWRLSWLGAGLPVPDLPDDDGLTNVIPLPRR